MIRRLSGAASHAVVAPAAFLVDLASPEVAAGLKAGSYTAFLPPDVVLQQVSVSDVGAVGAAMLLQPSRFTGQRIEIQELPLEVIRETGGEDFVRMVQFFRAGGYTVDIDALHRKHPDIRWTAFAEWVATADLQRAATDIMRV